MNVGVTVQWVRGDDCLDGSFGMLVLCFMIYYIFVA